METDFSSFKDRFDSIVERHTDLLTCMFAFGVQQASTHHRDRVGLYNPLKDKLAAEWSMDDFLKIKFGYDENGKNDGEEISVPHWEYCIKRAVEFHRPEWGYFYWIGFLTGLINAGEEEPQEFLRCLNFIPTRFLIRYSDRITFLHNYFDEKNVVLKIEGQGSACRV